MLQCARTSLQLLRGDLSNRPFHLASFLKKIPVHLKFLIHVQPRNNWGNYTPKLSRRLECSGSRPAPATC